MKNQERYSMCTKIILEIHFDFPVNVNNIITNKGERTNLRHLVKSGFEKLPLRKNCFNILFSFSSSLSLSFLSFLPAFDASVFISPIRTYSFGFVELFCPKKVMEGDYPPAPSTPPEPAPPDPSLSTASRDPRSNDRRLMLQQGLEGVPGLRRLVKASTMPAGGSHTSLEDITCKNDPLINTTDLFMAEYEP